MRAKRPPSLRLHKPTGQAVVTLNGKDHYCGKFGTEQAQERYDRLIAEWYANGRKPTVEAPQSGPTVSHLCLAYLRHAEGYYVKDGEPTAEVDCIRSALKEVRQLYGSLLVSEFRPKHLEAVLAAMAARELTRGFINRSLGRMKRAFKWATVQEICPPFVYHGLTAVRGLAYGRTQAVESKARQPVTEAQLKAVLPHLPKATADFLQLLRLTGARPGELFQLCPRLLDRSEAVWRFTPPRHKCQHLGKDRTILFGRQAQELLQRYLLRGPNDPCFEKPTGGPFTRFALSDALNAACEKAGIPRWTPYQCRHAFATAARAVSGLDETQVLMGHSRSTMTELYAKPDEGKAEELILKIG